MSNEEMLPLTGAVKRARYAVVDIESKDGDTQLAGFTRPFLAGFFDGENYVQSRGPNCVDEMLAFLCTAEHDGWSFYAHFGGSFDWLHFLPAIKRAGFSFEMYTVCSSIQMIVVKPRNRKSKGWAFLDSYKLIPTSLAKACISFNTKRKLSDHDLNLDEYDPAWEIYLRGDCESLYEVVDRFHDLVEVTLRGEVGITAAATAMKTYRRAYQTAPITRHTEHADFFRACYYGGRVEIFREKGEGLRYYDINSAYPFAMRENMPVGGLIELRDEKPSATLLSTHIGFTSACVDVPDDTHIPVLPVKHEGKLIFPTGRLRGYWTTAELLKAEQMGAKVQWRRTLMVEGRPALREYVDALYQYRDKSRPGYDEGLAQTAKILLNSLYGKFGMAKEKERVVSLNPGEPIPSGARPADPTNPDCTVWYVEEEVDAAYIIPQIAAYITALARLTLHSYLETAEGKGGGLYYCDTDSIITTTDLSAICSTALGGLKDEGAGHTYSGEFVQPKLYCLRDEQSADVKLATKGFKKLKLDEYRHLRDGGAISIRSLEKVGTMARNQFARGPEMRMIEKQLRGEDSKRIHLDHGHTRAIRLEHW